MSPTISPGDFEAELESPIVGIRRNAADNERAAIRPNGCGLNCEDAPIASLAGLIDECSGMGAMGKTEQIHLDSRSGFQLRFRPNQFFRGSM
jgi:hypothetical protein